MAKIRLKETTFYVPIFLPSFLDSQIPIRVKAFNSTHDRFNGRRTEDGHPSCLNSDPRTIFRLIHSREKALRTKEFGEELRDCKFTAASYTVLVLRMAHRIWKETKQEPGNMLGCC